MRKIYRGRMAIRGVSLPFCASIRPGSGVRRCRRAISISPAGTDGSSST